MSRPVVFVASVAVSLVVVALALILTWANPPQAIVNDLTGRGAADCHVVAVDGAPPTRIKSYIITWVPFVVVASGTHKFTVEQTKVGQTAKLRREFEATVAADVKYNIAEAADGTLSLVVEPERRREPDSASSPPLIELKP